MSDPTSFLNWQDYLGLNQGVGETMANRTLEEADRLETESRSAADERLNSAQHAGETGYLGHYERAGERSRKAQASYGEFMKALSDPASRRALMEKVYGKGAVSSRDAAMMGAQGGARIAQEQQDFNRSQTYAEERDIAGEQRLGASQSLAARQKALDIQGQQTRQARIDASKKLAAKNQKGLEWMGYHRMYNEANRNGNAVTSTAMAKNDDGSDMSVTDYNRKKNPYGFGGAGLLKTSSGGDF